MGKRMCVGEESGGKDNVYSGERLWGMERKKMCVGG